MPAVTSTSISIPGTANPVTISPDPAPTSPHARMASRQQAAMPSGVNSLIVGHAYGLDLRMIATVIVWSTLIVLTAGLVLSLL